MESILSLDNFMNWDKVLNFCGIYLYYRKSCINFCCVEVEILAKKKRSLWKILIDHVNIFFFQLLVYIYETLTWLLRLRGGMNHALTSVGVLMLLEGCLMTTWLGS